MTSSYGEEDLIVPVTHGQYYKSKLADSMLTVLGESGHLAVISHWADIIATSQRFTINGLHV